MNNSNLFKLNIQDVIKGITTAIIASVLIFIYNALTSNTSIDWHQVLKVAMSSGLGYVLKNFFSDQEGNLLGKF